MKKRFQYSTFILILIIYNLFPLNAQVDTDGNLSLSNYSFKTVSVQNPVCSIIGISTNETLKIVGKNSNLFSLSNNELYLNDNGIIYFQNNDRISVSLQLIATKGEIFEQSFLLIKDKFENNGIIAHRGAWKNTNTPQNSIASLKNAINLGCEGSEFDVHLTADEVVVVNHDPEINGITIEKANYKDLKKVALKNGEPLPTLKDFLKTGMQQEKTRLVCELKKSVISDERSRLLARNVMKIVRESKAQAWIVYISFDYSILKQILEIDPSTATMYLGGDVDPVQLKTDGNIGADYHYSVFQRNCDWISTAHYYGIKVNAWTVDDSLVADYLIAHNIDFITTNEPEIALKNWFPTKKLATKELVWCDEFNYKGLPDSTKWSYQVGGHGWGNNELQYYTMADTQNVSVVNGCLFITARKQQLENKEYTSTRLISKNKGNWKYGKIEIRARLPKGRGLWPAIWMLPTDNKYGGWLASGEIDIMEHVGYLLDFLFQTVHTKSFNHMIGTQVSKGIKMSDVYNDFHIYSIDWQQDKIDFYIDNNRCLTFKNSHKSFGEWPFDQQFYLLMNIAVGGGWGGKKGIDNTIFPATMEIDYVRVFQ
ncbi:MAG: family 16 glycosylhydrolase [Bacteroidales bacterium]|nr:family 16 glycosylhydrolase [Bacteroidales bacterium]